MCKCPDNDDDDEDNDGCGNNNDMIYLLSAIRLTPGGSSTVHIYTHIQYIEQHNRHKQYMEQHISLIRKSADRAPSLRVIP
jgi:hypothetical protein